MGQLWVAKFRNQRRISSWFCGWDGALPTFSCPYIIYKRFRCPKERSAGPLGSGVYSMTREQGTLNEYRTKTIHVGQSVVLQRKIEMLFPKEGGMDTGQAKTTDVHCSRSIWYCDEPKDQKLCKDTSISLSHTHTHNSVSVPRESPSHLIDFISLWFFSCFLEQCLPVSHLIPSAQFE